jgi:hypothetical protein
MELKHSVQKQTRDNRQVQHIRALAFADECAPLHKAGSLKQTSVLQIQTYCCKVNRITDTALNKGLHYISNVADKNGN